MRQIKIWILIGFLSGNGIAQKLRTVNATEVQLINEQISVSEFKYRVLEAAKLKALANEFGTMVVQGTDMVVKSQNASSSMNMTNISNAFIKGEWVKSDEEECKWILEQKGKEQFLYLECKVSGKAREINFAQTTFQANTLNCPESSCVTTQFKDKQKLFLQFKAPKAGFVTVFMRENNKVYRLLPYASMKESYDEGLPVEADKEYIFFSYRYKDYFPSESRSLVEYSLTTDSERTFNRVYVLYSSKPILKPLLTTIDGIKTMEPEAFVEWLNRVKASNPELQEKVVFISIEK
ncbi:MAG: hypothetical protein NZM38_04270 [Cytophagales bacterium]|nr:hypothetical protein [Cytophagales bacterium]MDW8383967.1 hypothetical protein [Flammeovirgaceae bacterium]